MDGFFTQVTVQTSRLVTSFEPIFLDIGVRMFTGMAIIRLSWEGFKIAFRTESVHRLAELMVLILIVYASLSYYATPIPAVGKSLTKIVTDAGSDLASVIDTSIETNIGTSLGKELGDVSGSTWDTVTSGGATMFRYFILEFILSGMQAGILAVIAFGFIVSGIYVLIGPVLVPFTLLPYFEWMAHNWFRGLIQYSFYPVIGNAFVFIYGQIWLNYFATLPSPLDSTAIAANITVIISLAMAGIYGILKVPSIVSHLFSGASGLGGFR